MKQTSVIQYTRGLTDGLVKSKQRCRSDETDGEVLGLAEGDEMGLADEPEEGDADGDLLWLAEADALGLAERNADGDVLGLS